MSVVAQTMGNLFVFIKIIGAAYLIFLGFRIWVSKPVPVSQQQVNGTKNMRYGHYLSGLGITLANPKVIIFYCGFLPTFMDLPSMTGFDIFIVTIVLAMVLFLVLIVYAYLASSARLFFSSPISVRWLNRTAGSVMITAGTVIAVKS
jgi:threonine/homoserine/homoserine lactone efflux protein